MQVKFCFTDTYRRWMDGESSIDSEQESDSSSGSDWMSEMEKSKGKQGGKRKIREQDGTYSKEKKKARSKSSPDPKEIFQEARNMKKLPVRCGKMAGLLCRKKYENGEKCISCKGHWFTPRQFEKFGGKENNKKWKSSIYYKLSNGLQQVQLERLIQNRCLPQYGHLRKSSTQVTQTDRCGANSSSQKNVTRRKAPNHNKPFTGSKENNSRNNSEIPVCGNEEDTVQKETIQMDNSSDESISVAERVKLNRREPVNSTETVSEKITEHKGSTGNEIDSPAPATDATEPAVSPVVEEVNQTTDEAAAAQLNFSDSPDEWQNPVASEETQETGQMQLFEFLANQFNTINNTLQSIDLSLKKLVDKQSQNILPQYISLTPAVIENPQIDTLVKEEPISEVVMT